MRAPLALGLCGALSVAASPQVPRTEEEAEPIVASLTLFAGSASGLWQSGNWGGTWRKAIGSPSGDSIEEVGQVNAILTTTTNVYLAAETGLYVSTDFGRTWEKKTDQAALSVLVSRYPMADLTLFVGTRSGLLKSPDAGRTFGPTAVAGAVSRLEWPGPELFAVTDRGVAISRDGADSIAVRPAGLAPGPVRSLTLSSMWSLDPVAFVGVEGAGLYRTRDGGGSWELVAFEGGTVNDLFWFGPFLYAAAEHGFFLSQNAGESWEQWGQGLEGVEPRRLLFPRYPESGSELFLATSGGVYRSLDGGRRFRPSGLAEEDVSAVATFPPPDRTRDPRRR